MKKESINLYDQWCDIGHDIKTNEYELLTLGLIIKQKYVNLPPINNQAVICDSECDYL